MVNVDPLPPTPSNYQQRQAVSIYRRMHISIYTYIHTYVLIFLCIYIYIICWHKFSCILFNVRQYLYYYIVLQLYVVCCLCACMYCEQYRLPERNGFYRIQTDEVTVAVVKCDFGWWYKLRDGFEYVIHQNQRCSEWRVPCTSCKCHFICNDIHACVQYRYHSISNNTYFGIYYDLKAQWHRTSSSNIMLTHSRCYSLFLK